MKISNKFLASVAIAGSMSLAGCEKPVSTDLAVCQADGDGKYEVVDPKTNQKLIVMGDVYKDKPDYVWGQSLEPVSPFDPGYQGQSTRPYVHSGFNVYLDKAGAVTSCQMGEGDGSETYLPKPKGLEL